jgi:hypothetical protein
MTESGSRRYEKSDPDPNKIGTSKWHSNHICSTYTHSTHKYSTMVMIQDCCDNTTEILISFIDAIRRRCHPQKVEQVLLNSSRVGLQYALNTVPKVFLRSELLSVRTGNVTR